MSSKNKVTALLIAENFNNHSLGPVTASTPFALLPIHNTPLIDFHLELLVRNRVNEVFVVAFRHYKRIFQHLSSTRTATGKCWTESKEIKVHPIEGSDKVSSLYEAFQEVRSKNITPPHFVFVSIDSICTMTNIRELYAAHVARLETVPKQLLTVVVTPASSLLRDTHDAVNDEFADIFSTRYDAAQHAAHQHRHQQHPHGARHGRRDSSGDAPFMPPETPLAPSILPGEFNFAVDSRNILPRYPALSHVTIAYDPVSHTVKQYKKWATDPNAVSSNTTALAPFALPPGTFKRPVKIRSDLELSGIFICCQAVAEAFTQFFPDVSELLEDILVRQETTGTEFCLDFASSGACTRHLTSIPSYVNANIDATARFLHPMTRSSNFAESNSNYSCSHRHLSSVFLHFERDASVNSATLGPRVVVGPSCRIPASATIRDCVLGRNVRIGNDVVLVGCVVLDDVVIADGASAHFSVLCSGARIGGNTRISPHCVVGAGVVISGGPAGAAVLLTAGTLLCRSKDDPTAADRDVVGERGVGVVYNADAAGHEAALGVSKSAVACETRLLFVDDAPPTDDSVCENDDPMAEFVQFMRCRVADALRSPGSSNHVLWEMKQCRHTYGQDNSVLIKVGTMLLLEAFAQNLADSKEKKTPKEAYAELKAVLTEWEEPFYEALMQTPLDVDALLTGLSLGLDFFPKGGDTGNPLHARASHILAFFYTTDNEKISSLMSKKAILDFDDFSQELESDEEELRQPEDSRMLRGWGYFSRYIEQLRALSDDEEDES